MFTSPLDNIRVASPCPADWDQMFGDERKRFCSECKLNVYNLSGMTRREAENLLISTEGRLCVRFFKRADGTVLTADCPVGWAALKRRAARIATAAASMLFGFASGLIAFRSSETVLFQPTMGTVPAPVSNIDSTELTPVVGDVYPKDEMEYQGQIVVGMPVLERKTRFHTASHRKGR